ncbi:MAG: lysophospholipid acyltransferase family protein [Sulfitobacter litoralis]|uniref:lysophospholipid acyltransferase family protein n=1 Tax=Sulfitobacter TaxID=60136 RepID=UPI001B71A8B8|nr:MULTISPECIES: lysophospholipid acyltransferase family protein [Sulfitobacter]MBQ0766362.1 lysophospholipid acyltransferase family protein [Sulfitobacter litoralis]MBQ0800410.1 lysophospholipid acyltransferase family protein [Sulfitobacter litoralis]
MTLLQPDLRPLTARDISYAYSAKSRPARAFIRLMENSTGRLGLMKRATGYEDDMARGIGFFDVMVQRYGLTLDVVGGSLANIPETGPVIALANHPYGILDGLMLGHMLARRRDGFKIMAHSVFNRAPDLNRHLLPISFDEDKAALALNLRTRKIALEYLGQGGAVGIFPGGTVSTSARPFSRPMDPGWRSFTARMIAKSDATVVPIYFDGHTSRLFQIASHLHHTLRMGLLIKEFRKRVDTRVRVVIGEPIGRNALDPMAKDAKAMMDFLRKATYELSPDLAKSFDLGFEFEDRHRADR